ncbi:hypothetical protein [Thermoanaerobacterium sp. RBIITD]|uniref:hypothetical protein n=1 Tax=Thermoanaerobacterium sp. RBIITD TaxID=1550240 RepID=UPI000BB935BD|nr:hypothetical protein [Thermoanaerobacterium sp. RBIITD]SNX53203.1 hypothetical protein SAMN05660242_0703 [Thermoanaerobacterium sp. RBIITD]
MGDLIKFETHKHIYYDSYKRCDFSSVRKDLNYLLKGDFDYNISYKAKALIDIFKEAVAKINMKNNLREYIYILCDNKANILDVISPDSFIDFCDSINLKPGYSLNEKYSGTNAVALALMEKCKVFIKKEEHYCALFHNLYCIANPIFGDQNKIIGAFDISYISDKNYIYMPNYKNFIC